MENNELPGLPPTHKKVIQPVSDMSEYKPAEPAGAAAAPPAQVPPRPIYPEAKRDAQTMPAQTVPHTNETKSYVSDDSAAARVPVLRMYAIINIVYALYLAYRLVTVGSPGTAAVLQGLLLGSTAFHLIIGAYLLAAKDLRVVSGLLLGLLISDGLAVLNMAVAFIQVHRYVHTGAVWSLLLALGLLIFTWYARSRVDLVSVET